MIKKVPIIGIARLVITAFLLYKVYFETGPFTVVILILTIIYCETKK